MATTTTKTAEKPSAKLVTGLVRFSYLHAFKPEKMDDDDEPKYSVQLLIDKSDKVTLKKLEKAVELAIQQGIERKATWGGKRPAKIKLPLRDGDDERPDDEAYAGKFFISAKTKTKPGIVDKDLNEILDETEVVSGDYGRASITAYPFEGKQNGVAIALNHIQLVKKGEPLGASKSSAEDDFGDGVEFDDEDEDDLDSIM